MEKGILLIALGHPNYGKMAAALAATIRCMNKTLPIALVANTDGIRHLAPQEKALFSKIIYPDRRFYTTAEGQFTPLKPRVFFNELSPFDKTLCLDADNLWIQGNDPQKVFDALEGTAFTISNDGHTITDSHADQDKSQWGDIQDISTAYKIQNRKFYKVYAEWFYFEKNEFSEKLFLEAQQIFTEPAKCPTIQFIGQPITEELAFCIAMARLSLYPHAEPYFPTFWYYREPAVSGRFPFELKGKYFSYSLGGNTTPEWHINIYNNLAAYAYQSLGIRAPYRWKNKKDFIPEREKI